MRRTALTAVPQLVAKHAILSTYFFREFPILTWASLIAFFGWMTIHLPVIIYLFFGLAAVLALAGLAARVRGSSERKEIIALGAIAALAIALLVQFNRTFSQPQGRLLFPALTALAVLAAVGLEGTSFWNRRICYAAIALFGALNVLILATVIVPAYWIPDPHGAGQACLECTLPVQSEPGPF